MRALLKAACALALLLSPSLAFADQPQDWMVGPTEKGTYVNIDMTFGGILRLYSDIGGGGS